MTHQYWVVDAFTSKPLEGNPVAVFFGADDLSGTQMQAIAAEMKLSEVTFVLSPGKDGDARIRIFTPVNELPFAGHPMLGTAVALACSTGRGSLRLETAMGVIPCEIGTGNGAAEVTMAQPVPSWRPYEHAAGLLAALGVSAPAVPVEVYHNGPRHVLVGLESVAALSALRPDQRALAAFPDMAANCFAGAGNVWRMRMFSPAYGVAEDAATGSAAGPLAIHLARHQLAGYCQDIEIHQGVEMGRPSLMKANVRSRDGRPYSVRVSGSGVVIARGTIYLLPET
jgi:trans-2,3-dihydro-3-hydroxyanthranilate isomerase